MSSESGGRGKITILDIKEDELKNGVLGLVVAIVEIIQDALRLQAIKRMEGGSLSAEEIERLGEALLDLEDAIEKIKVEMGISESVRSVRQGLDGIVDDVIDSIVNPSQWARAAPVPHEGQGI